MHVIESISINNLYQDPKVHEDTLDRTEISIQLHEVTSSSTLAKRVYPVTTFKLILRRQCLYVMLRNTYINSFGIYHHPKIISNTVYRHIPAQGANQTLRRGLSPWIHPCPPSSQITPPTRLVRPSPSTKRSAYPCSNHRSNHLFPYHSFLSFDAQSTVPPFVFSHIMSTNSTHLFL
jgi:hypothetical protein